MMLSRQFVKYTYLLKHQYFLSEIAISGDDDELHRWLLFVRPEEGMEGGKERWPAVTTVISVGDRSLLIPRGR